MSKEIIICNNEVLKQQETKMAKEIKERINELLTFAIGDYSERIKFEVFDRGCPHKETKPTEKKIRQELSITDKEEAIFHSAVYMFYYPCKEEYLKIGEVGGNSTARFFNQHYNPDSANSTLAKSIVESKEFHTKENKLVCNDNVKDWMVDNLQRIDIIFKNQTIDLFQSL